MVCSSTNVSLIRRGDAIPSGSQMPNKSPGRPVLDSTEGTITVESKDAHFTVFAELTAGWVGSVEASAPQWGGTGWLQAQESDWLDATSAALHGLGALEKGWDGEDAEPPNEFAIRNADQVLLILRAFARKPHRVEPSVEGGVMLVFRNPIDREYYADIECFNDGTILGAISLGRSRLPIVRPLTPSLDSIHSFFSGGNFAVGI